MLKFKAFHQTLGFVEEINDLYWFEENYVHNTDDSNNYKIVQWMGLKDNKGREIYEGDIYRRWWYPDYKDYVVEYDNKIGGFFLGDELIGDGVEWRDYEYMGTLMKRKMMIKFLYYYTIARIRGLYQNYIRGNDYNLLAPAVHEGVSCCITKFSEIKTMYFKHDWVPYCITKNGSNYVCKMLDLSNFKTSKKVILNSIYGVKPK